MVAGAAHAARAASLRRPMTQPSRAALAAAFAAVYLIWGSTYLAIRWGVAEIPPFLMAGGRFVGAGLVFVAWAACRGAARPTARDWLATALIGLLMAAGGNGLISWALQRVPSGLGALLVAMVPFWVTLADWLRPRGARPPGRVILGPRARVHGGGPARRSGRRCRRAHPRPDGRGHHRPGQPAVGGRLGLLPLRPPAGFAAALVRHADARRRGAVLLAMSAAAGEPAGLDWGAVSPAAFAAWIYVAAFGSVAYGCYLWLLKASTPSKAATYAYVNPVIALLLGYLLAGETLSPWSLGCSAVVVTGVLLVVSR